MNTLPMPSYIAASAIYEFNHYKPELFLKFCMSNKTMTCAAHLQQNQQWKAGKLLHPSQYEFLAGSTSPRQSYIYIYIGMIGSDGMAFWLDFAKYPAQCAEI